MSAAVGDHDVNGGALVGDPHDVVERRARDARHHADDPRRARERTLSAFLEEALYLELLAQLLEAGGQVARTRREHDAREELRSAGGLVERHLAAHAHALTLLHLRAGALGVVAEEQHRELCPLTLVAEREVHVARPRARDLADLALDPEVGEARLELRADGPVHLTDAIDARLFARSARAMPPTRLAHDTLTRRSRSINGLRSIQW